VAYLVSALVLVAYFVCDYRNLWVHPHYFADVMPVYTQDGHGFHATDLLRAMDHKRPGECRPRFLMYAFLGLDIRAREWLYRYCCVHPTFSLTWVFTLGLSPLLLYRLVRNLTGERASALLGVAIFLTSVGTLSGCTCFFTSGKYLTSTVFLGALLLASEVFKAAAPPGQLLFRGGPVKVAALLGLLFLGLFLDEFTALAFCLVPIVFPELFWPRGRRFSRDVVANACLFLAPLALFLVVVVGVVPLVTQRYLGYEFDFLGSALSYQGAEVPGPHPSAARLTAANFFSLFGTSVVPNALSKLLPHPASPVANLLRQEINRLKLGLFAVLVPGALLLARRAGGRPNFFLRSCAAAVAFLVAHTALNARHLPVTNGYYYGASFGVILALLCAFFHAQVARSGGRFAAVACQLAVGWVLVVQVANFDRINRSWRDAHNCWSCREAVQQLPDLKLRFRDRKLTAGELRAIWSAWRGGRLRDYLAHTDVAPGAVYLVAELLERGNPALANPLPGGADTRPGLAPHGMPPLVWLFLGWIGVHFGLYALLLRHLGAFGRERGIFLYHAVPAAAVAVAALAAAVAAPAWAGPAEVVLVIGLQGIYSLSFLELWALAEGGYSVAILIRLEAARRAAAEVDPAGLEQFGAGKKTGRLAGLQRLSLIQPEGQGYRLTRRGRVVAAAMHALARLSNLKEAG
jgi:hypothetical protein